jgi:hypothetical protein
MLLPSQTELWNRSRDRCDNLGRPRGERQLCRRLPRVPARGPRRASLSLARRPLPSCTAVHCGYQAHEREEAVRLSVFKFAVREAGKPSKPPPVRRPGISVVPLRQCLRCKGSEELWKDRSVFQPGLKVASTGLDNGASIETISHEHGLVEIVEHGIAMFARRADVDGGPIFHFNRALLNSSP